MCEVALGNSMPLTHPFYVEDIPNASFQSVKGVGYYYPSQYKFVDGILAPYHGIATSNRQTEISANEFVVYNPNQVKIKYLFKMKFNFIDFEEI